MKTYILNLLVVGASLGVASLASAADTAAKPPKTPKFHLSFENADVDKSGGLTIFEFATTQGPGTPLVEIRRRFLGIDVSGAFEVIIDPLTGEQALDPITSEPVFGDPIPDGLVTLEELKTWRALEVKPKSDLPRFELADFDGDGNLTPVEFGYLVSQRVPVKNVVRKFNKLDDDDDGLLSKGEFKKSKALDL